MAAKKPLKYRNLKKILKSFGISEEKVRGKGSHRMFVGVVGGRVIHHPTRCHNENDEKPIPVINAIRRAFRLTEDDGIKDNDFYDRG